MQEGKKDGFETYIEAPAWPSKSSAMETSSVLFLSVSSWELPVGRKVADGWLSTMAGCDGRSDCAACVEKFERRSKDSLCGRSFGSTYSRSSGSALASKHRKTFAVEINCQKLAESWLEYSSCLFFSHSSPGLIQKRLIVSTLLSFVRNSIAISTKLTRCMERIMFQSSRFRIHGTNAK